MPFTPNNVAWKSRTHSTSHPCVNSPQLRLLRWVHKDGKSLRVPADQVALLVQGGWLIGRGENPEKFRSKNPRTSNPGAFKQGQPAHNKGISMSAEQKDKMAATRFRLHGPSKKAQQASWYADRLVEQDKRCALCPRSSALERDHNHACCDKNGGSVYNGGCRLCWRGMLCSPCNKDLGKLEAMMSKMVTAPQFLPDTWEAGALAYLAHYQLSNP